MQAAPELPPDLDLATLRPLQRDQELEELFQPKPKAPAPAPAPSPPRNLPQVSRVPGVLFGDAVAWGQNRDWERPWDPYKS